MRETKWKAFSDVGLQMIPTGKGRRKKERTITSKLEGDK